MAAAAVVAEAAAVVPVAVAAEGVAAVVAAAAAAVAVDAAAVSGVRPSASHSALCHSTTPSELTYQQQPRCCCLDDVTRWHSC